MNIDKGVDVMNKWRKKMREKRKKRNYGERFTVLDFLLELLCWIPEVLIFPFRMVYWLFRGIVKLFGEM
ncbi:hypothetical protein AAEO50_00810 [Rossellomorea oryzaecorticis]|uniref:Uncharacterized protein n=1 Tax=Rossellomorea oryzaecorticis TaxID=1396505 RepID=A0ABU9K514_9BACI